MTRVTPESWVRAAVLKDLDTAHNAKLLEAYLEAKARHRAAVRAGRPSSPPPAKPTVRHTKQRQAWETKGPIVRHFDNVEIRVH